MEFSASVQRELAQGLSANVPYFRRIYTTSSRRTPAVGPAITTPSASRPRRHPSLPNGGGQRICGIPDLTPAKVGLASITHDASRQLRTRRRHWNGVTRRSMRAFGASCCRGRAERREELGGRVLLASALPEAIYLLSPPAYSRSTTITHFAATEPPRWQHDAYLTQLKLSSDRTCCRTTSGAADLQTLPGPMRTANVTFFNAVVAALVGRPLSQTQCQVNVIEPDGTRNDCISSTAGSRRS